MFLRLTEYPKPNNRASDVVALSKFIRVFIQSGRCRNRSCLKAMVLTVDILRTER